MKTKKKSKKRSIQQTITNYIYRYRYVVVAVIFGLIGVALLRISHANKLSCPAGAPYQYGACSQRASVIEWNIAGYAMNKGAVDPNPGNYASGQTITDSVTRAILQNDFLSGSNVAVGNEMATFSEICNGQFNTIKQSLIKAGWPTDNNRFAYYAPDATQSSSGKAACPGGDKSVGVAIFSRQPFTKLQTYSLCSTTACSSTDHTPNGRVSLRKIICGRVSLTNQVDASSHLVFCGTHVTTVNANQPVELATIQKVINGYHASGDTVVTAGDFNEEPFTLTNRDMAKYLYSGNTELDQNDPLHCPSHPSDLSYGYGENSTISNDQIVKKPGYACAINPNPSNLKKIDFIFASKDKLVNGFTTDAANKTNGETVIDASPSCPANKRNGSNISFDGQCSDHRMLHASLMLRVN